MKRLFAVLTAIVICSSFQYASAQQPPKKENNCQNAHALHNKAPKPDMNNDMIMSQKVAFYTRELNLTTDEAMKFWPVHNEFSQAQHKAHKETMKALKELNRAIRSTEACNAPANHPECKEGKPATGKDGKPAPKKDMKPATDKEIDVLAQKYMKALSAEKEVIATFYPKFKSVLPVAKAAKVFSTEEKFRNFIIKSLKKPGEGMQMPGQMHGQPGNPGQPGQKGSEPHGCGPEPHGCEMEMCF